MTVRPEIFTSTKGVRTMKSHRLESVLFAGLLLIGTAAVAAAQTPTQGEDPHHPAQTEAAPAPAAPGEAAPGAPEGMPGMMTPQMMQMMQNMMGQGGMGGMMGQGGMMGGMAGQGMPKGGMGQGMMCPMMQMMMGARAGMGGLGMQLGMPRGSQEEMTPDRVRTIVEEHLTRQGNPRLKLGEVAMAADGSITAEIVTVDGSLVQKLAFNRYPGLFRQVE
jgi:hypothetical protein